MHKIIVLTIKSRFGDMESIIHPVVLKDEEHMVLIDCGYTGFLPELEQAAADHTLSFGELTHVLITHQDHDHMGALAALKQKYPKLQVVAGEKEAPYISGQLKSLRLLQAEALQRDLPDEEKAFGLAFCDILKNVQQAAVDIMVRDGDVFDWCGGCTVLETPGHTPGHISLYVNKEKVLITGDAAALEDNQLVIANPLYTLDIKEAEASLNKILNYGAKEIICYHGGTYLP